MTEISVVEFVRGTAWIERLNNVNMLRSVLRLVFIILEVCIFFNKVTLTNVPREVMDGVEDE